MAWCEMDIDSGKVSFNKKKAEMLGYPEDQFHHYEDFTKLVHTDDYESMMTSMRALLEGTNDKYDIEYRIKAQSGEYRWFHDIGTIIDRREGAPLKVAGIVLDITDSKSKYEELQETRKRFDLAIEGTGAGLWDWDMGSDRVVYSKRWKSMLGYEDHEIENSFYGWKKLWYPDDAPRIEKSMQDYLEGKTEKYEIIHRLLHKDGTWRWILTRGGILKDSEGTPYRWVGTNLDITNSKQNEEKLKKAVEEKDYLMKELHQHNEVDRIEISEYFQEILKSVFSFSSKLDVYIENKIDEVSVRTKTAIPLGLIVNEIATNAIKYGFTSGEAAHFTVTLSEEIKSRQYTLTLSNTGNAFPENVGLENPETMGLQLVSTLVNQLNGTIELQKEPSPVFTIHFPMEG